MGIDIERLKEILMAKHLFLEKDKKRLEKIWRDQVEPAYNESSEDGEFYTWQQLQAEFKDFVKSARVRRDHLF